MKKNILITAMTLLLISPNVHALTIEFDYRYDNNNFFSGDNIHRRAVLEHAASFYSVFIDSLSAIQPDLNAGNTWTARFKNPSPGSSPYAFYSIDNLSIAADTVKVFVGASHSDFGGVLGFASSMSFEAHGDHNFINDISSRGQGVTTGAYANDFGALGGSIGFYSNHDWHFGIDGGGLASNQPDFLTTAIHEIGHILGYGPARSWQNLIDGDGLFHGNAAMAVYGEPVPTLLSHWAEGTTSYYNGVPQETMMDPSTPYGQRQMPTDLDMAGFYDIGWTPVPLPPAFLLLLTGLVILIRLKKQADN